MPYAKENSQLTKSWVEETLKLKPGEEIFIPCDSKSAQASLKTRLYGARKEYASIDPVAAESISFSPVWRDGEPFIKCYKSKKEANKAFFKDTEGNIKEITVSAEKDRTRKILMMIKDGKKMLDVESALGKLSAEEKSMFKKKRVFDKSTHQTD